MRKLKLQMQMSADGFVAGPEGQLDWMSLEMDPKHLEYLQEITDSMDTILMGRKMTSGFTTYWESVVNTQPDSPEYPYAKVFVDTPKIVFSRTLKVVEGKNVVVENGDLLDSVNQLKNKKGRDIIVYGGVNFVCELIKHNLIDEFNFFINPVAIGNGLKIFDDRFKLKLISSTFFNNGIVFNRYNPLPA